MLFGCSSATMIHNNSEPHGITHSFLMNDCPSVLGCLWDVTDKDIDKLT
jgi:separase